MPSNNLTKLTRHVPISVGGPRPKPVKTQRQKDREIAAYTKAAKGHLAMAETNPESAEAHKEAAADYAAKAKAVA